MLKRLHCCAFLIGASLLMLALVVGLRSAQHPARASQTVRVAQTVADLQGGCLTCHTSQADTTLDLHHYPVDQPVQEPPVVAALQSTVDDQLADLGQRILALPDNTARQDEVANAFLQAYDVTRNITAESLAVWHIHSVERLLQDLINQASPYRMTRQDSTRFQPDSTALNSGAPASPVYAALSQGVPIGESAAARWAIPDTHQWVMPLEHVFAAHRRGPPAGLFLDSVWHGRLLSMDNSLLLFWKTSIFC
jgi:hypothetical protein